MTKLSEMMKEKQLLSFELFPPKTDKGMENLPGTIETLCEFKPFYRYQKHQRRYQRAAADLPG